MKIDSKNLHTKPGGIHQTKLRYLPLLAGHLEAGSDVRTVMRFLVALKGQGGALGEVQQPVLAELRPRIVHQKEVCMHSEVTSQPHSQFISSLPKHKIL